MGFVAAIRKSRELCRRVFEEFERCIFCELMHRTDGGGPADPDATGPTGASTGPDAPSAAAPVRVGLFTTPRARCAYRSDMMLSSRLQRAGERLTNISVFAVPPRESLSTCVSS